ncbi:MAG: efflux transporter outer membrane subunit [Chakrabartia sp.]
MPYSSRLFQTSLGLSLAAALSACATLPKVTPSAAPKTLASLPSDQSLPGAGGQFPQEDWWRVLDDPALDALMTEALAAAPDMRIATARIAAADALAEQAGSALAPALSVEGQAGGMKQSYNMGIPAQFVPKGILSSGRLTGSFNLNLDIWGRNRAALAAARGEATAARVDAAQTRLLLTTSLATAWVDYAQALAVQDIAADVTRLRQEVETLTESRVAAGIDAQSDLDLARSRRATAQAEQAGADEAAALTRNRIAALLGAGPDRGAQLPRPALKNRPAQPLPDALAAGLLGRRPDIVSARLRAEAAAARVDVAKRDFYPNINLTALAGVQSLGLSNLFQTSSETANFGPAISLPLFDGGRLAGRYRTAHANYGEAVARYDQTLIAALRETADVVAARQALDQRLRAMETANVAAEQSAQLARLRYQAGIGTLLQLNAAMDAALSARRGLTEAKARADTLDIALIRALGGGFRDNRPMKDAPAP